MGNLNYIAGIIKILESPKQQKVKKQNILATKFRAQLPQLRGTRIIDLSFWGNLAKDVLTYYKVNDYLMIEGYISLREENNLSSQKRKSKKVEITVLKAYPILLNHDPFSTKI